MATDPPPVASNGQRFWSKVLCVGAGYLLLQLTMLWAIAPGWSKYAVLQPPESFQYWDAGIYAQLAIAPQCTAFYPLWPRLVQAIGHSETWSQALRWSTVSSTVLFLASLPLALFTLEKLIKQRRIAFLIFFLYALGPNAIFHTIGYTESLFSVMSWGCLLLITSIEDRPPNPAKNHSWQLSLLFLLSLLMGLTRPMLVQSLGAIAFSLGAIWISRPCRRDRQNGRWPDFAGATVELASAIGLGSIAGYAIYGGYCWQTVGNFWAPFQAQVAWGRTLGLRPWLLVLPRSLLIDLHGLYLPLLLMAAMLGLLWGCRQRHDRLLLTLPRSPWLYGLLVHPLAFTLGLLGLRRLGRSHLDAVKIPVNPDWSAYLGRFSILYAIAVCNAHALINLLINSGHLHSTARHVFGTPFAFVGLGALLAALNLPTLNRVTWGIAIAGVGLLAHQWLAYAQDGWLG